MRELSLHILDLVQNSISANASLIEIDILEDMIRDLLKIDIIDNGFGMSKEFLEKVTDPFVTTRTSRKVGLGISLMLSACRRCEGDFIIDSDKDVGTSITATFKHSHIDRVPLGNMTETMISLILCSPKTDFVYKHVINTYNHDIKQFSFDTREIKAILGADVSLTEPDIIIWIKEYISEGLEELNFTEKI